MNEKINFYEFSYVKRVKIVLTTGETLIVDTESCGDTYDDNDEEEQDIIVKVRPESPDWPFEYDMIILTDKDILSMEKL